MVDEGRLCYDLGMSSEDTKRLGNLLQNAATAIYDAQRLYERMCKDERESAPLDPVSVTRTLSDLERRIKRIERDCTPSGAPN